MRPILACAMIWPMQSISQHCYMVWSRFDPDGLAAFIRQHGKIRVRVPAPRQRWPEPTVG